MGIVDLREDITTGQRVARYRVDVRDDGAWRTIEDAVERPEFVRLGCYGES